MTDQQDPRRRLKGFGLHLMGYFVVMGLLVAVNLFTAPDNPWFIGPVVGWGGVLAVHAAFVMGLFGAGRAREITAERFTVMVDDNFHYTDEEHRYKHGAFSTYAEAVDACKKILDNELEDMLKQGIDHKDLSAKWAQFGSDPFIIGGSEIFSSRDYVMAWGGS